MEMSVNSLKYNKKIALVTHVVKERVMLLKYYRLFAKSRGGNMIVSRFDSRRMGYGLNDRLKSIVSMYALSKVLKAEFRCEFTHPFNLADYLVPNKYNWLQEKDEINQSFCGTKVIIAQGEPGVGRILRSFSRKRQLHVYANRDYLDEINRLFGTHFVWGDLFNELFKPSELLQNNLKKYSFSEGYIACAFRFRSILGDFDDGNCAVLNEDEKERLIKLLKDKIIELRETSQKKVFVTSDSQKFLSMLDGLDDVFTNEGRIVHIDNVATSDDNAYLRTFMDYYMLANSEHIYSIGTPQMYRSQFHEYAAKLNGIPFERIEL